MEIIQTRFIISVEEAVVLGRSIDSEVVSNVLTKALTNGSKPKVVVEEVPVPAQRQLAGRTKYEYANCPKCGNRIAKVYMRRHQAGKICRTNRKKYKEQLAGVNLT
jgi:hypothetical protein